MDVLTATDPVQPVATDEAPAQAEDAASAAEGKPEKQKKARKKDEAPAATAAARPVAKSRIKFGRGDKRFVFEAGQPLDGLTADEIDVLRKQGAV